MARSYGWPGAEGGYVAHSATHGAGHKSTAHSPKPGARFEREQSLREVFIFFAVLLGGLAYVAWSIWSDIQRADVGVLTFAPFLLLFLALLIALGFEFVNGFHDTANAVATVIYTNSLPAHFAVVWSGCWNFIGVLVSSGAVAFGIISLLPVELILNVGSSAGMAMVFSLLVAAILWNLGTWYLGLPASSSHTLIGSIIGVGLANQLMHTADGTAGVDWGQAANVGYSLLLSPVVGFVAAGLLLVTMKVLVKNPALYRAPKENHAPPWWIRGLLVVTCTGVSFAHGSNDGQKGMGLIMLILIGIVPTAYALNRAVDPADVAQFRALAQATQVSLLASQPGAAPVADPRAVLTTFVGDRKVQPDTVPALAAVAGEIAQLVATHNSLSQVPAAAVPNMRNDMYLASETIAIMQRMQAPSFDAQTTQNLIAFKRSLDEATKFIPLWVKVAVAIALGLGTMVGWKRIVVTVGEKIGKSHLTYAQGGAAELVAMGTILAADHYGLPVSTTHVLSSGVAGTMAANHSGLQWSTVRNLAMAWVLTLPAAIVLAGGIYVLLLQIF
ncbi:inorganic phosphate transporter [Aquabacter sp. L1I39]|uniref:inorganic phosphate transporter n=1 Tax=Aquabacter sp. L1I39 TaxID=2820278 RepID=UPI001ADA427D|nr:inorganic phosphate transporter [Aquabacter sp. L1I39]QTL05194.1 inorganic phosphate transporter [Aquabacter sp. L1I39]